MGGTRTCAVSAAGMDARANARRLTSGCDSRGDLVASRVSKNAVAVSVGAVSESTPDLEDANHQLARCGEDRRSSDLHTWLAHGEGDHAVCGAVEDFQMGIPAR